MATRAEIEQADLKKQKKTLEDEIAKLSKSRLTKAKLKGGTTSGEAEARRRLSDLRQQLTEIDKKLSVVDTMAGPVPANETMTPAYALEQLVYTRSALDELRNKKTLTRQDHAKMLEYEQRIRNYANIAGVTLASKPKPSLPEDAPPQPYAGSTGKPTEPGIVRPAADSLRAVSQLIRMERNPYGWNEEQQQMRDQLRRIFLSNEIGQVPFQAPVADSFGGEAEAIRNVAESKYGGDTSKVTSRDLMSLEALPAYEGFTFGPSRGQPGGSVLPKSRDVDVMNGMSVKNIYAMYFDLNEKELVTFQKQLMEAGLFGDKVKPALGRRDPETRLALENLMQIWGGSAPDKPIGELLAQLKREKASKKRDQINQLLGTDDTSNIPVEVRLTSKESLSAIIDKVAVDLFGSGIDPARKEELISRFQATERRQQIQAASMSRRAQARSAIPDLDLFVDALIGQESGGNPAATNDRTGAYGIGQILPENWDGWARQAGVDPTDTSAEAQRRVIEWKVASDYADWGNWDDVASIWYSGSRTSQLSPEAMTRGQGPSGDEPSIQTYIDSVRSRMESLRKQRLGSGPMVYEYEDFNPEAAAMAELKAADPSRYVATQFRRQADVFFGMLAGIRR